MVSASSSILNFDRYAESGVEMLIAVRARQIQAYEHVRTFSDAEADQAHARCSSISNEKRVPVSGADSTWSDVPIARRKS